jgi:hypothetical protein
MRGLLCLLGVLVASAAQAGGTLPVLDDNSGSFTTQVPFEVPPGPPGGTPSLGLFYSSAAGLGPVGMGWSFPQSSVRLDLKWGVPERWFEGPDLCDPYAFNGRLYIDDHEAVPNPGDPLAPNVDGCVFRTRPDTFSGARC